MSISEKPLLEPHAPKPGIPLKKSTLAVLVLLLLGLGLISSLLMSGSGTASAAPAVQTDPVRQPGTPQALREEEERAKGARPPAAAASAAAPAVARPASASLPPVPESVRRSDSVAAVYDRQSRGQRPGAVADASSDRDLELESATRTAKAVVFDIDDGSTTSPAARVLGASGGSAAAPVGRTSEPEAPSAAFNAQLEALKGHLTGKASPEQRPSGWMKEYAKDTADRRELIKGSPPPPGLILRQGKVIPAVLGRQINSDLPGRITAYTSANVYDSQGHLLIPMGSALVGEYDSGVRVGQSRMMFAFERLILPNGYSFNLPTAPGSDLAGAAGMTGDVNNHFFRMFGTSLLIAVLADKTKPPQNVTQLGGGTTLTAAGQVLTDVSRSILDRNRVIPPTITVPQGTRINVEVVADMVFPQPYSAK